MVDGSYLNLVGGAFRKSVNSVTVNDAIGSERLVRITGPTNFDLVVVDSGAAAPLW